MPEESLLERIQLYGPRASLFLIVLIALGLLFLVAGGVAGQPELIMVGVLVLVVGVTLWMIQRTEMAKITKRYFTPETLTGKTGSARASIRANTKGVVYLEHEYWSAIAVEDLRSGDPIVVVSVEPDKVTLRVKKSQP